jgi:hypothetical protein
MPATDAISRASPSFIRLRTRASTACTLARVASTGAPAGMSTFT